MRILLTIALLTLAALPSAMPEATGAVSGKVQLVYESDTRGYYLPCG